MRSSQTRYVRCGVVWGFRMLGVWGIVRVSIPDGPGEAYPTLGQSKRPLLICALHQRYSAVIGETLRNLAHFMDCCVNLGSSADMFRIFRPRHLPLRSTYNNLTGPQRQNARCYIFFLNHTKLFRLNPQILDDLDVSEKITEKRFAINRSFLIR
jgi:hypothetical protein